MPEPVAWTLVRRGLGDPAAAREFLASRRPAGAGRVPARHRRGGRPPGPRRAAGRADRRARRLRLRRHLPPRRSWCAALRGRGARVVPFLPSRFTEGYGVAEATRGARWPTRGARVLVCVDCGTSAVDALTRAVELGMEPIVLDHHLAGGARPPGILANPALGRPAEDLPAAAGVVHMLVRALAARLGRRRRWPRTPRRRIDLVALATVADAVPLVGDNRRLVARGLARDARAPRARRSPPSARRPGSSPARSARARSASPWPRASTPPGAWPTPTARSSCCWRPTREAADPLGGRAVGAQPGAPRGGARDRRARPWPMVEAEPDEIRGGAIIVAAGDGWHEGVVGIVASRLAERFERPAIVISRDPGDRAAKGSGRSLPGVDLHALVAAGGRRADPLGRAPGGRRAWSCRPSDVAALPRRPHARRPRARAAAIARARVRAGRRRGGRARPRPAPRPRPSRRSPPSGAATRRCGWWCPGAEPASPVRVGEGRHLQVRLRAGRRPRPGHRLPHGRARRRTSTAAERHDAMVRLEVERWQELVGPELVLEALEPLRAGRRPGSPASAPRPATSRCPDRVSAPGLRALVDAPERAAAAAPPAGAAPGRCATCAGAGAAALRRSPRWPGADGGVVAVRGRRRPAPRGAGRARSRRAGWGSRSPCSGGGRCDPEALRGPPGAGPRRAGAGDARLRAPGRGGPARRARTWSLVDPPADAEAAGVGRRAGPRAGSCTWPGAPDEVAFALGVAEAEWELRPVAADLWRGAGRRRRPRPGARRSRRCSWATARPSARPGPWPGRWPCCATSAWSRWARTACAPGLPAPRRDLGESLRHRAAQARLRGLPRVPRPRDDARPGPQTSAAATTFQGSTRHEVTRPATT